jgi:hypothetical protein
MGIYAFICKDGGDKGAVRRQHLIEHLRYVESVMDSVVVAGPCPPTAPGDARQFAGSIMMYRAKTEAAARALFEGDPYVKNRVWDAVEMMNFTPVAGDYIGGQTWAIVDGKMERRDPFKAKQQP